MENILNIITTLFYMLKKGEFTMIFTTKHYIVDVWYRRVANGICTFEEVPKLFNLRDVVKELLDQKVTDQPVSE